MALVKLIKHIPNTVTLINLACGCIGIIYCLEGKYEFVLLAVAIALLADFADGLLARALNANSDLGMQLDSLADGVTFGVLPGVILYVLLEDAIGRPFVDFQEHFLRVEHIGFVYTLFAVLRLGKFNIDSRQTDSFLGLPTPAAAIFVLGLLVIKQYAISPFDAWLGNITVLIAICGMLAALMISEIPMFSFKVRGLLWQGNQTQVVFVVLCIIVGIALKWASFPAIILLYVLISIVGNLIWGKSGTTNLSSDKNQVDSGGDKEVSNF